jgi:hypothetical protein
MTGKAFFCFDNDDASRAVIVLGSALAHGIAPAGFADKGEFEQLEARGEQAVSDWIDQQLEGTSVTVVLVGAKTCANRWVNYEIEKSVERGNGLLGIDISKIEDYQGKTTQRCGQIPLGYQFYLWLRNDGYNRLGEWIGTAAKAAGK